MAPSSDREFQTLAPTGVAGYQQWRDLTFLHWRVPVEQLQPLVPDGLTIETFDGSAWLGIVPFSMERIRPWWAPPIPGISWFLETNLRTYVRHSNGTSGVWFFSLDANSRIAVTTACTFWNLPYRFAEMTRTVQPDEGNVSYTGLRRSTPKAEYEICIGRDAESKPDVAAVGSLEHFLIERYVLFSRDAQHRLFTGQVFHPPYQFCSVAVPRCQQTLTAAIGIVIPEDRPADHAVFSAGVDVCVSRLKRIHDNADTP